MNPDEQAEELARRGAEMGERFSVKIQRFNLIKLVTMEINEITGIIIQEAIQIHKNDGPVLMETVYEELLSFRLKKYHHFDIIRQGHIPLLYEEVRLDVNLRFDMMVEEKVLVDIKSKETVPPVDYRIFKTYLRLTNISVGLVINFNVEVLKDGIKRVVNNYKDN